MTRKTGFILVALSALIGLRLLITGDLGTVVVHEATFSWDEWVRISMTFYPKLHLFVPICLVILVGFIAMVFGRRSIDPEEEFIKHALNEFCQTHDGGN